MPHLGGNGRKDAELGVGQPEMGSSCSYEWLGLGPSSLQQGLVQSSMAAQVCNPGLRQSLAAGTSQAADRGELVQRQGHPSPEI